MKLLYKISSLIPARMKQKSPGIIKKWFKKKDYKLSDYIYSFGNVNSYSKKTALKKRALFSYITKPFRLSYDDPQNIQFSNIGIARSIVNILNELGYIVDVIEWLDTNFKPKERYDLFIGHGGCNFKHISRRLPSDVVKIYFSTGFYWKEHNRLEKERFRKLRKRRSIHLPYDRLIHYSEEYANQSADGIICLGDQIVKGSYSKFPIVINLNNAAYHDDRYERIDKDYAYGRKNFLFFSGGGNVHKGLDLLLESFIQVDAHLYICQKIDSKFYKLYRCELENFPNIHSIGVIPMRGHQFYELVDICNYVISPSCSEGRQRSIVECMHQGLIPIVSKESGINMDDFGIVLKTCSIPEITKVIKNLSRQPTNWCKEMSQKTRDAAVSKFSVEAFLQNIRNAIQEIVVHKTKL